jgi:hypothetical protein
MVPPRAATLTVTVAVSVVVAAIVVVVMRAAQMVCEESSENHDIQSMNRRSLTMSSTSRRSSPPLTMSLESAEPDPGSPSTVERPVPTPV